MSLINNKIVNECEFIEKANLKINKIQKQLLQSKSDEKEIIVYFNEQLRNIDKAQTELINLIKIKMGLLRQKVNIIFTEYQNQFTKNKLIYKTFIDELNSTVENLEIITKGSSDQEEIKGYVDGKLDNMISHFDNFSLSNTNLFPFYLPPQPLTLSDDAFGVLKYKNSIKSNHWINLDECIFNSNDNLEENLSQIFSSSKNVFNQNLYNEVKTEQNTNTPFKSEQTSKPIFNTATEATKKINLSKFENNILALNHSNKQKKSINVRELSEMISSGFTLQKNNSHLNCPSSNSKRVMTQPSIEEKNVKNNAYVKGRNKSIGKPGRELSKQSSKKSNLNKEYLSTEASKGSHSLSKKKSTSIVKKMLNQSPPRFSCKSSRVTSGSRSKKIPCKGKKNSIPIGKKITSSRSYRCIQTEG